MSTDQERAPGHVGAMGGVIYDSKFGNWERRASVRTKPVRTLTDGHPTVFFPPELVPALHHPLVSRRGPEAAQRLLLQSLYGYLHFTVVLEQVAVIPVTGRIALGQSGVAVPAPMRADAFKITTDEAWHAQFSYDFVEQLVERCGVPVAAPPQPQLVRRLDRIRRTVEPNAHPLVDLVFAVVSETLVSAFLSELPNDKRLPHPVRALVQDHAEDEGRHHAYFRAFLRFLWPQLSDAQRRLVAPRVPELVEAFLAPDLEAVALALRDAGLDQRETAVVVDECYRAVPDTGRIVAGSRATVQSFAEVGALGDPETYEAFAARGLVERDATP